MVVLEAVVVLEGVVVLEAVVPQLVTVKEGDMVFTAATQLTRGSNQNTSYDKGLSG